MAKCQFCGKETEQIITTTDQLDLCGECNNTRQVALAEQAMKKQAEEEKEMEKNKAKVVDINDFEEVKDENTEAAPAENQVNNVKCEIILGVRDDGSLYFNVGGNDTNLLLIEGLLEYGKRKLKQIWEQRDAEIFAAMQRQAEEQAEK